MSRKNETKVTYQSERTTVNENGKPLTTTSTKSIVIKSEEDYIKIYFRGLNYIRDMPQDCFALLCVLFKYTSYAEKAASDGVNYSFVITINKHIRQEIAKELGYKNIDSISNVITQLLDGGVMIRLTNGVYRLNPFLFGRGKYEHLVNLRKPKAGFEPPNDGDTFMSVYKYNVATKRFDKAIKKATTPEEMQAAYKIMEDYANSLPPIKK